MVVLGVLMAAVPLMADDAREDGFGIRMGFGTTPASGEGMFLLSDGTERKASGWTFRRMYGEFRPVHPDANTAATYEVLPASGNGNGFSYTVLAGVDGVTGIKGVRKGSSLEDFGKAKLEVAALYPNAKVSEKPGACWWFDKDAEWPAASCSLSGGLLDVSFSAPTQWSASRLFQFI